MTTAPPKRRKWLQFRLRTLLIAILVLSLPLSWFAVRLKRARRQRQAVQMIEQLGGFVDEREQPSVPKWIRASLPNGFSMDVVEVRLVDNKSRNAKLNILKAVSTEVADAGLEHLKGLTRLHDLNLNDARVSLQGCQKLHESLPDCTILCHGRILSPLSQTHK